MASYSIREHAGRSDPTFQRRSDNDMEAYLSTAVSLKEIQSCGCFTVFPVRRPDDLKAFKAARDEICAMWKEELQDDEFINKSNFTANDAQGDYCGITYPETRPERVKPFTWLYIMFFMLDDKVEYLTRFEAKKLHGRLKNIIQGEGRLAPETPLERLFTRVIKAFLAVNRTQGTFALNAWVNWLENTHERDIDSFTSFDEFVAYRHNNFGFPPFCAMVAYAMDIDITPSDLEAIRPQLYIIGLSCQMTNDYWSSPKEMAAFEKGLGYPVDAVTALHKIEGLPIDKAMLKVKNLAMKYEDQAMQAANDLIGPSSTLPVNVKRYVKGIYWAAGGASLWSSTCPRYNAFKRSEPHAKAK